MIQQLIPAAACRILVNNQNVGYATSIVYQRSQGVRVIYGIDDPLPQEIAITGPYSIQGQITGFRSRAGGGFDGLRAVNASSLTDYFNQNYSVIEIYDRGTGQLIGKVDKAIFHVDSVNITSKGLITLNANFVGTFLTTITSVGSQ